MNTHIRFDAWPDVEPLDPRAVDQWGYDEEAVTSDLREAVAGVMAEHGFRVGLLPGAVSVHHKYADGER